MLQTLTEDGHCAFARDGLIKKAVKVLEIPEPIIETALDNEIKEDRLVQRDQPEGAPLVYLASLDDSERSLARNLINLVKTPHPCPPVDMPKAIDWTEKQMGLALAPAQKEALGLAARSKVMVITGGLQGSASCRPR